MLLCLHVEFVFMLKDNPPSKLRLSISSAQICLFCEKYENPRNLGIVRACADKSHLCLTKSVPRGFLKVMLLEKVIKFSFLLIAIIRYFTLSSKQIMSILKKFLIFKFPSDCKPRLKSNFTMKVRGFFTGH